MKRKNPAALVQSAQKLVRDLGWVLKLGQDEYTLPNPLRASILDAYDMACSHLLALDPDGGPEFIRKTYGPPPIFRLKKLGIIS